MIADELTARSWQASSRQDKEDGGACSSLPSTGGVPVADMHDSGALCLDSNIYVVHGTFAANNGVLDLELAWRPGRVAAADEPPHPTRRWWLAGARAVAPDLPTFMWGSDEQAALCDAGRPIGTRCAAIRKGQRVARVRCQKPWMRRLVKQGSRQLSRTSREGLAVSHGVDRTVASLASSDRAQCASTQLDRCARRAMATRCGGTRACAAPFAVGRAGEPAGL
jgi:hypothetical protein